MSGFNPQSLVRILASVYSNLKRAHGYQGELFEPIKIGDAVFEGSTGSRLMAYSSIGIVTEISGDDPLYPDRVVIDSIEGKSVSWTNCIFTKLPENTTMIVKEIVKDAKTANNR